MTQAERWAFALGRKRYREGREPVPNPCGLSAALVAAFRAGYGYEKATHPRPLTPAFER